MTSWPLVSVIMPVYNEEAFITRALGAVLAQDYPPDRLEVLVVDGLSEDQTVPLVEALSAGDGRVRVLSNPQRIQAHALNIGVDAAQGDIIARVDGHTIIAPDYIRRCVDHLLATGADNVGGPLHVIGVTPLGQAISAAYRSPFGVPSRYTVSQRAGYVDTLFPGAWPRTVFERIGRFNTAVGANEDYEFNYRTRQAGGRIYMTPDIRLEYYGRQTLGALWRQFFYYGDSKFRTLSRHPTSVRPRHLVAPIFVVVLTGGALSAAIQRRIAPLWALVVGSYGLATLAASAVAASRSGWRHIIRLPVVFASMHVAWGSGFWYRAMRWLAARGREGKL